MLSPWQFGAPLERLRYDPRHMSHVTRHTSHVTCHTSHVTRHTPHVTRHTSHVTRQTSHVTRHTSHVTRHTSHVTRHTSHVTRPHSTHAMRQSCFNTLFGGPVSPISSPKQSCGTAVAVQVQLVIYITTAQLLPTLAMAPQHCNTRACAYHYGGGRRRPSRWLCFVRQTR